MWVPPTTPSLTPVKGFPQSPIGTPLYFWKKEMEHWVQCSLSATRSCEQMHFWKQRKGNLWQAPDNHFLSTQGLFFISVASRARAPQGVRSWAFCTWVSYFALHQGSIQQIYWGSTHKRPKRAQESSQVVTQRFSSSASAILSHSYHHRDTQLGWYFGPLSGWPPLSRTTATSHVWLLSTWNWPVWTEMC